MQYHLAKDFFTKITCHSETTPMNAVLSNKSPTYASKPYIKSKNTKIYNPQLNSAHCASFNKFYITKMKIFSTK